MYQDRVIVQSSNTPQCVWLGIISSISFMYCVILNFIIIHAHMNRDLCSWVMPNWCFYSASFFKKKKNQWYMIGSHTHLDSHIFMYSFCVIFQISTGSGTAIYIAASHSWWGINVLVGGRVVGVGLKWKSFITVVFPPGIHPVWILVFFCIHIWVKKERSGVCCCGVSVLNQFD